MQKILLNYTYNNNKGKKQQEELLEKEQRKSLRHFKLSHGFRF